MAYYLTMERTHMVTQHGMVVIDSTLVDKVNEWIDARWVKDIALTAKDLYLWANDCDLPMGGSKLEPRNDTNSSVWLEVAVYEALYALCPTLDVVWDKRLILEDPEYGNFGALPV